MAGAGWRVLGGLVVLPAVVGALAGCGNGGGNGGGGSAAPAASTAKAAAATKMTAPMLKGALLTRVNGVAAAGPATSGQYATVSRASIGKAGTGNQAAGGTQVTPKACAGTAVQGLDPAAFAAAPAAAVSFNVGGNAVSEVLIASSAKSASAALAARVPAGCTRYQEKTGAKTVTYGVTEHPFTGVGLQAKVVNVQDTGVAADSQWSLVYRGTGFVGAVTVTGPNASQKAVQELGQQAYAFAAKSLS